MAAGGVTGRQADRDGQPVDLEPTRCSSVDGIVVTAAELVAAAAGQPGPCRGGHPHPPRPPPPRLRHPDAGLPRGRRACERGRTKLLAETAYPYDAPADGAGQPGADFLTSRGFEFGLADVKRVLDLPVDDKILARLAAQAAPHHETYSIAFLRRAGARGVRGAVRRAGRRASSPTPRWATSSSSRPWPTFARSGRTRPLMQRQRRTRYTTWRSPPTATVVAYTDLLMPGEDPGAVFQSGTLVRREHRGHRLGLAVKVANLRFLQAQRDDGRILDHVQRRDQRPHGPESTSRWAFGPSNGWGSSRSGSPEIAWTR